MHSEFNGDYLVQYTTKKEEICVCVYVQFILDRIFLRIVDAYHISSRATTTQPLHFCVSWSYLLLLLLCSAESAEYPKPAFNNEFFFKNSLVCVKDLYLSHFYVYTLLTFSHFFRDIFEFTSYNNKIHKGVE